MYKVTHLWQFHFITFSLTQKDLSDLTFLASFGTVHPSLPETLPSLSVQLSTFYRNFLWMYVCTCIWCLFPDLTGFPGLPHFWFLFLSNLL